LKVRSYPPQAVWTSSSYYPEVVGGAIEGQVLPPDKLDRRYPRRLYGSAAHTTLRRFEGRRAIECQVLPPDMLDIGYFRRLYEPAAHTTLRGSEGARGSVGGY